MSLYLIDINILPALKKINEIKYKKYRRQSKDANITLNVSSYECIFTNIQKINGNEIHKYRRQ